MTASMRNSFITCAPIYILLVVSVTCGMVT
jgi:hypothetical protein